MTFQRELQAGVSPLPFWPWAETLIPLPIDADEEARMRFYHGDSWAPPTQTALVLG